MAQEIAKGVAGGPGGWGILVCCLGLGAWMFIKLALTLNWIAVPHHDTNKRYESTASFQDVVKYCAGQQATLKGDMNNGFKIMVENLSESLKRGERSFERIDSKLDTIGERLAKVETSVEDLKKQQA